MKKKIIFDFDGVIINVEKPFCETYNEIYKDHPDFVFADWENNTRWSLKDVCPLVKDYREIFDSTEFVFKWDFYDEYTEDVLRSLAEDYELVVCTCGTSMNIATKSLWIKHQLPFVKNAILLYNETYKPSDKGIVDMTGALFIDDRASNLEDSNAEHKICFGKELDTNKDTSFIRVYDFKELDTVIRKTF